jgi:hypothetical protein
MARPRTFIRKAELAAVLELSPGRVTQLIAKGLPVRADGRVNRDEAVLWYRSNVREDIAKRGPKPKVRVVPAGGATEKPATGDAYIEIDYGARGVFESLIANSARVPETLCELGVRDPVALAVSAELFCDLVFVLAGAQSNAAYDWCGNDDRSPTPVVNLRKLAKKYGFKFDRAAVRMDFKKGRERSSAEQLIEKWDGLLFPPPKAAA